MTTQQYQPMASGWQQPPPPQPGPSTAGYWIAVAMVVFAFIGATIWGIGGSIAAVTAADSFARAPIPGTSELVLPRSGRFVIYLEGSAQTASDVGVALTGPSGDAISLSEYSGEMTYTSGDHSGTAFADFTAPVAGAYVLHTRGTLSDTSGGVAVGEDLSTPMMNAFLRPVAMFLVLLVVAAGLVLTTVMRRSSARARSRSLQWSSGPPAPWTYPPQR